MPVIGPWFRKADRRGKWHAGRHVESVPVGDRGQAVKRYTALCGFQETVFIESAFVLASDGPAPDDAHGVCLHCLRAIEMEHRADEARR